MTKKWWTKFFFLILVTVISGLYILPTFTKVGSDPKSAFPFSKKINLGLDLQGGLYLVMGVDFNKVFKEIAERQLTSVTDIFKHASIPLTSQPLRLDGVPQDDPRLTLNFAAAQKQAAKDLLAKKFPNLRFTD